MSVCEAYSTPIVQHDTGDVIQMTECAAYISHPAVGKHQQERHDLFINRTLKIHHCVTLAPMSCVLKYFVISKLFLGLTLLPGRTQILKLILFSKQC